MLSLFAAFSQATTYFLSKVLMQRGFAECKSALSFIKYFLVSLCLWASYRYETGIVWWSGNLEYTFWLVLIGSLAVSVTAELSKLKALHLADLSYLTPFMAFTPILTIVPAFIFLSEQPSWMQFAGIVVVVSGAFIMEYRFDGAEVKTDASKQASKRLALLFFGITLLCYSISPIFIKHIILQTSPNFAALLILQGLALSFAVMVLVFNQGRPAIFALKQNGALVILFGMVIVSALGILGEYIAYDNANVTSVIAVKRFMPLFAFVLGYVFLRERKKAKQRLLATMVMIAGALMLVQ